MALLAERPRTLAELVAARLLYPPDYEEIWIDDAERRSIGQHLEELAASGRVRARDDGVFELTGR